jgi:GT2 family glycosyltransferase
VKQFEYNGAGRTPEKADSAKGEFDMLGQTVHASEEKSPGYLNARILESMFWTPDHVDKFSAWTEHVPFAFWITEALQPSCVVELGTYYGVSYLAFCQAVHRLGLDTRCYAVDTWQGDEHSGFYGEEVFQELTKHHDGRYGHFSQLVRSRFDEAVTHFDDRSIELLHIDGLHTFEAVRDDFEMWKPKLASRAVVLFHDTNVRERKFGVYKLWRQLAEAHAHFEFLHGHGLGVLGLGSGFPRTVAALFEASGQPQTTRRVRELFARLGAQLSIFPRFEQQVAEAQRLSAELAMRDAEVTELDHGLSAQRAEAQRLSAELAARDRRLRSLESMIAAHRSDLDRHWKVLMERDTRIDELEGALAARRADLQRLSTELTMLRARLQEIKHSASWRLTRPLRGSASQSREAAKVVGKVFRKTARLACCPLTRPLGRLALNYGPLKGLSWLLPKSDRRMAKTVWRLRRTSLFDEQWYLQRYPDVARARKDPVLHYVRSGAKKGRDPNPLFDSDWYLAQNPDVAAAGRNPLEHYLSHGAAEGRDPNPLFDSDWYLAQNPDVAAAGRNPLEHYLSHGQAEGRAPLSFRRDVDPALQEKALGLYIRSIRPRSVVVGIVTYNNSDRDLRRIVSTDKVALSIGTVVEPRILLLDNAAPTSNALLDEPLLRHFASNGNIGFGAGHNVLMRPAFEDGADVYVTANPDGGFHPDCIACILRMLEAADDKALVEARQFPEEHPKVYDPESMETPWASAACLAIPKNIYSQIGGFDERFFMYCEDVDLSWRAHAAGFSTKLCPTAYFFHSVTNRVFDSKRHHMYLASGLKLAHKWRSSAFESAIMQELRRHGYAVPTLSGQPVPLDHTRFANFGHKFSFALTRW